MKVKIGKEDKSPMRVKKKYTIRTLMKSAKTALVVFSILGVTVTFISCSNSSQQRYQPAPGTPPSWENDYGRPEPDGERIFSKGFHL